MLFKEAFTHIDNRKVLIDFLSSLINFNLDFLHSVHLTVKYEKILYKTKHNDKSIRGNILIEFDNYKISLERFTCFNTEFFHNSISYIINISSTKMESANRNYDLPKGAFYIILLDNAEGLFDGNINSQYCIVNADDINGDPLKEKFRMNYYNLSKIKDKTYDGLTKDARWLKFIEAESAEDRKLIAKEDKLLMEFDNWIEKYVNDETTRQIFVEHTI